MNDESTNIVQPPDSAPAQKSLLSRFAHSLYVFCGFFVLFYSLCLVGFSVYSFETGKELGQLEQFAIPAVGLTFLTASLYVFIGKHRWHAWVTGTIFLFSLVLCSSVLIIRVLEPQGHGLPELIGGIAFSAFMLGGTVIKARGHWQARCWTPN